MQINTMWLIYSHPHHIPHQQNSCLIDFPWVSSQSPPSITQVDPRHAPPCCSKHRCLRVLPSWCLVHQTWLDKSYENRWFTWKNGDLWTMAMWWILNGTSPINWYMNGNMIKHKEDFRWLRLILWSVLGRWVSWKRANKCSWKWVDHHGKCATEYLYVYIFM